MKQCPNSDGVQEEIHNMGVFGLSLFLLKLKTETENTVAK